MNPTRRALLATLLAGTALAACTSTGTPTVVPATVISTASSDERLERLREFGLDHPINYVKTDFEQEVRALTNGRGADVILDSVGGPNLQKSIRSLAYRGRCVSFGDAGRNGGADLDVSSMRGNNQSLTGYFLGAELFFGTRAYQMVDSLLADVARGDEAPEVAVTGHAADDGGLTRGRLERGEPLGLEPAEAELRLGLAPAVGAAVESSVTVTVACADWSASVR
jgi:Zn-dependent alcohol dehydrogenase